MDAKKSMQPAPATEQASFDDKNEWRRLALKFDGQRMQALWHLQAMLEDPAKHAAVATEFLGAAPLSGEAVIVERFAERIALCATQAERVQRISGAELATDERDALADLRNAVKEGADDEWLLGFIRGYPFIQAERVQQLQEQLDLANEHLRQAVENIAKMKTAERVQSSESIDKWEVSYERERAYWGEHDKTPYMQAELDARRATASKAEAPGVDAWSLADALYERGYRDSKNERDYDARAGEEWQSVVDAIAATTKQGTP